MSSDKGRTCGGRAFMARPPKMPSSACQTYHMQASRVPCHATSRAPIGGMEENVLTDIRLDQWKKQAHSCNRSGNIADGQATVCFLEAVGHCNILAKSGKTNQMHRWNCKLPSSGCFKNTLWMDGRICGMVDRQDTPPPAAELKLRLEMEGLDSAQKSMRRSSRSSLAV